MVTTVFYVRRVTFYARPSEDYRSALTDSWDEKLRGEGLAEDSSYQEANENLLLHFEKHFI